MCTARENFQQWFVTPLRKLNEDGHAAFAVLMIAFPLLERYLREKSGVFEATQLTEPFYNEFHRIFDDLPRESVPKLWHCYRNGLLHQATFSKKTSRGSVMPSSFITPNVELIHYDSASDAFYVNPRVFSERVVEEIERNFTVFEGLSSDNHPLPAVTASLSGCRLATDGPDPTGVM